MYKSIKSSFLSSLCTLKIVMTKYNDTDFFKILTTFVWKMFNLIFPMDFQYIFEIT